MKKIETEHQEKETIHTYSAEFEKMLDGPPMVMVGYVNEKGEKKECLVPQFSLREDFKNATNQKSEFIFRLNNNIQSLNSIHHNFAFFKLW